MNIDVNVSVITIVSINANHIDSIETLIQTLIILIFVLVSTCRVVIPVLSLLIPSISQLISISHRYGADSCFYSKPHKVGNRVKAK